MPLSTPRKNPRGKPTTHDRLRCNDLASRYPTRDYYSSYPAFALRARAFFADLTTKVPNLKLVIVKDYVERLILEHEAEAKRKKKDPNRYLLTNHLDATVAWVIRCYKSRYEIERAFREAK